LAASNSGSILSLLLCRKFSKPTTSCRIILKTPKLPLRPSSGGSRTSARRGLLRFFALWKRAPGHSSRRCLRQGHGSGRLPLEFFANIRKTTGVGGRDASLNFHG
jgi:hypothetical protein